MGALKRDNQFVILYTIIFPVRCSFVLSPFQYHNALQKAQMQYRLLHCFQRHLGSFRPILILSLAPLREWTSCRASVKNLKKIEFLLGDTGIFAQAYPRQTKNVPQRTNEVLTISLFLYIFSILIYIVILTGGNHQLISLYFCDGLSNLRIFIFIVFCIFYFVSN